MRIGQTTDETNQKLLDFGKAIGKVTVQAKVSCNMFLYYMIMDTILGKFSDRVTTVNYFFNIFRILPDLL